MALDIIGVASIPRGEEKKMGRGRERPSFLLLSPLRTLPLPQVESVVPTGLSGRVAARRDVVAQTGEHRESLGRQ